MLRRGCAVRLAIAAALGCLAAGCKPSQEAPRTPHRVAALGARWAPEVLVGEPDVENWLRGLRDAGPDTGGNGDADAGGPPERGDVVAAETSARSDGLTEAVIAELRREPSRSARKRARKARRRAQKLYRASEIEGAMAGYRQAIAAWPGDPDARFGLAACLARKGKGDEALAELAHLFALGTRPALKLLDRARGDTVFTSLRERPGFERMVGYLPVEVCRAAKLEKAAEEAVVRRLRRVGIPAFGCRRASWGSSPSVPTVFYRADDRRAERVAHEVAQAAWLPPRVLASKWLKKRPVVFVVTSVELAGPDPGEARKRLDDFLGMVLEASQGGGEDRLTLLKTGLFTWTTVEPSGRREVRSGRYHLRGTKLHLSYRLTIETPAPDGSQPGLETELGRRSNHQLHLTGDSLVLDDLEFRPAAEDGPGEP